MDESFPFYIFRFEKQFPKMKEHNLELDGLEKDYIRIKDEIGKLEESGQLDSYSKAALRNMIENVVQNLARKYPAVQEGVKTIMGGKVLDYEAKQIKRSGIEEGLKTGLEQGRAEGRKQGRAEGRQEGQLENLILNLKNLMENLCVSADEAMRLLNVSETLKPKLRDLL